MALGGFRVNTESLSSIHQLMFNLRLDALIFTEMMNRGSQRLDDLLSDVDRLEKSIHESNESSSS